MPPGSPPMSSSAGTTPAGHPADSSSASTSTCAASAAAHMSSGSSTRPTLRNPPPPPWDGDCERPMGLADDDRVLLRILEDTCVPIFFFRSPEPNSTSPVNSSTQLKCFWFTPLRFGMTSARNASAFAFITELMSSPPPPPRSSSACDSWRHRLAKRRMMTAACMLRTALYASPCSECSSGVMSTRGSGVTTAHTMRSRAPAMDARPMRLRADAASCAVPIKFAAALRRASSSSSCSILDSFLRWTPRSRDDSAYSTSARLFCSSARAASRRASSLARRSRVSVSLCSTSPFALATSRSSFLLRRVSLAAWRHLSQLSSSSPLPMMLRITRLAVSRCRLRRTASSRHT
mmetsp:Transcript_2875/g.6473  ORF Transcript_2875/g.6473 Transcript_2875/m.6473 type:complete len:348 (+) Transcript_2875:230-1273(+)